MPKATFEDFIRENPRYQSIRNNPDAEKAFEILSKNENIFNAIQLSKIHKPALKSSVDELESELGNPESEFDLSVDFNRQGVGLMQKCILRPFGYQLIPNSAKSFTARFFRTASCYEYQAGTATMSINVMVSEIERQS